MQRQVIEFAGEPVGIVVPDNNRLKFIAVKYHVHDLDEQRFDSADDVRLAIRNLVRNRDVAALV
jgi:Rps23 Pro-64 3,4-dihydroxylase Tpa1-like proline 4-hydroxylase